MLAWAKVCLSWHCCCSVIYLWMHPISVQLYFDPFCHIYFPFGVGWIKPCVWVCTTQQSLLFLFKESRFISLTLHSHKFILLSLRLWMFYTQHNCHDVFVFIRPPGQFSIPDTRGFFQDANLGTFVRSPLTPLLCSGRCCKSFWGLWTNSSIFKEFKEGKMCMCV